MKPAVIFALLGITSASLIQKRIQSQSFVQLQDHENDTDDVIPDLDKAFVQLDDHENDTEDLLQTKNTPQWEVYLEEAGQTVKNTQQASNQKLMQEYQNEEEESSYEMVQLGFDHEADTDDMPEGQDPVMAQFNHESDEDDIPEGQEPIMAQTEWRENDTEDMPEGQDPVMLMVRDEDQFHGKSIGELLQVDDEDLEFDDSDVVLLRYTVDHHNEDTDDIVEELSPENYDSKHSKEWNRAVEKQAVALENQIKVEENSIESAKKAKEEAKIRAIEVAKNEAAERKRMEELKKHPAKPVNAVPKTINEVDLGAIYGNLATFDKLSDKDFD